MKTLTKVIVILKFKLIKKQGFIDSGTLYVYKK